MLKSLVLFVVLLDILLSFVASESTTKPTTDAGIPMNLVSPLSFLGKLDVGRYLFYSI